MYSVHDEKFEGPLDLLLSLIEKEKLDITQISLAKITSSYLETIGQLQGDSSELAEFLLIAAKLLYLKSKELIPSAETDEEEAEIEDLEQRLRDYQAYKEAAKHFDSVLSELNRSYTKRSKPQVPKSFTPPEGIDNQTLLAIFQDVISRVNEEAPTQVELKTEKKITLEEKRSDIIKHLQKGKKLSFRKLLGGTTTRSEIIVTFLAILEMIKQKEVRVEQEGNFADLTLSGI